jgi:conjugal transfer/entry exclusion protein
MIITRQLAILLFFFGGKMTFAMHFPQTYITEQILPDLQGLQSISDEYKEDSEDINDINDQFIERYETKFYDFESNDSLDTYR